MSNKRWRQLPKGYGAPPPRSVPVPFPAPVRWQDATVEQIRDNLSLFIDYCKASAAQREELS